MVPVRPVYVNYAAHFVPKGPLTPGVRPPPPGRSRRAFDPLNSAAGGCRERFEPEFGFLEDQNQVVGLGGGRGLVESTG